jgi:DNA-nicking Smr family endonuclease
MPEKKPPDLALWNIATAGIQKLKGQEKIHPTPPKYSKPKLFPVDKLGTIQLETILPQQSPRNTSPSSFQIDAKYKKRLKQGDVKLDGSIDLHDLTLHQAHQKFMQFLSQHIAKKSRCLLVITGQGKPKGEGVIRKNFPLWCEDAVIKPFILNLQQAHIKHGGDGAFYLLLRRVRA